MKRPDIRGWVGRIGTRFIIGVSILVDKIIWGLKTATYTTVIGGLLIALAYGFYLSLGWSIPGLWVAFGSFLLFVIGLGAFAGVPFAIGRSAPWPLKSSIFRIYGWLFQKALGRALVVKREHAGVELCSSVWDPDHGSEHVKLDGEWRDFEDVGDRMRYLKSGGAFGIIDEASTLIIDPVDAAIGGRRKEIIEASEEVVDFGRGIGECVREHAVLSKRPPLVDLRNAKYLLGGNADPTDAKATEEFEKKAWAGYNDIEMTTAMVMAGLFAATGFIIWLAFSFAEGDSSGSAGQTSNIVSGTLVPLWWVIRP